jgi:hypothetical protein
MKKNEYLIRLDTRNFNYSDNQGNLEKQIINDTCKALNGLEWKYKTEKGLINRINSILGFYIEKGTLSKNNSLIIEHEIYGGKRKIKKALPGICSGAFSIKYIIKNINLNREVKIPFSHFYDTRSIDKSLNLDKCYMILYRKSVSK